ncbi:potassium channel subfamily K member 7 [Hemicordylus capensis]|uniref:potassium channel subfamily K member 7 n=1 Tax=Hemicordylus capensis TaxID=884348 RepID=UPI002304C56F|nr:potassium channel subfamily K member 7 [Hemicordylus capensis]
MSLLPKLSSAGSVVSWARKRTEDSEGGRRKNEGSTGGRRDLESNQIRSLLLQPPIRNQTKRNQTCWRFGLLLGAYGLFLVLGAAVFSALEEPPERALQGALHAARARLLAQHGQCLSEAQLAALLERLLDAGSYGVSGLGNVSGDENWEFTSALFFVASVLTTTGYGHTVPLSNWGKVFCILYALVGIPMTLLLLACLLQSLLPLLSYRPVQYIHRRWGFPLGHVALLHALGLGLATLGLFILVPAICFWALEGNWNFLESVYFCFISLSTIGLGDYVPRGSSQPPLHELYELSITCYLLLGLLAMLVALETAYKLQEVRGLFRFFAPAHDTPHTDDDDHLEILDQDQLALTTISGGTSHNEPAEQGAT